MEKTSELVSVIKPIYYVSKLLGLAPYSLSSKPLSLLSISYIVVLSVLVAYNIWSLIFLSHNGSKFPNTTLFLNILDDGIVLSSAIICWFTILLQNKICIKLINDTCNIQCVIEHLGTKIPFKHYLRFQLLHIPYVLFISAIKSGIEVYFMEKTYGFWLADIVNLIVVMQFAMFLMLVGEHYKMVNTELQKLKNSRLNENNLINNNQIYAIRTFYRISTLWKTSTINLISSSNPLVQSVIIKIRSLRHVHNKLFSLSNLLNKVYSLPILLFSANYITMITVSLYNMYYFGVFAVDNYSLRNPLFWVNIFSFALIAGHNFIQLLIIVYACDIILCEVSRYFNLIKYLYHLINYYYSLLIVITVFT